MIFQSIGLVAAATLIDRTAQALPLHCTAAPTFPVPLSAGIFHSVEFPVGRHAYNICLYVDRRLPTKQLDCDLGPATAGSQCDAPPLLDVEWSIWDHGTLVSNWSFQPRQASSWSETETGCMLGGFEGRRNGMFTLQWNVKKDAGGLVGLHPRVQIVKDPGYWCWL
jgi:hypothetical protein